LLLVNIYKILSVFNRLILRSYNNGYILLLFVKYLMFDKKKYSNQVKKINRE
jgi:hypothetical protein